jgi:hypothetical protein
MGNNPLGKLKKKNLGKTLPLTLDLMQFSMKISSSPTKFSQAWLVSLKINSLLLKNDHN